MGVSDSQWIVTNRELHSCIEVKFVLTYASIIRKSEAIGINLEWGIIL